MICELFPFQKQAVNEMRLRVAMALNNYRMLKIPQVVFAPGTNGFRQNDYHVCPD